MAMRSQVLADIALVRQSLRRAGSPHRPLLTLQEWRPVVDVALDILVIVAMLSLALGEPWTLPIVLLVLGNRQRALGNILHDAAHRNLARNRLLNDLATQALVAPLLFVSLARYRELHFRHHLDLGTRDADPDLIAIPAVKALSWVAAFARNVLSTRAVVGSTLGHLVDREVLPGARLHIVAWWSLLVAALVSLASAATAMTVLCLWLVARATSFHAITTFREMCDHHGLTPAGVFGFTRDITSERPWTLLFHPRNNAYHLTHHLLPAIPYYRLPEAQRLFATLPEYEARAQVCSSYFAGPMPTVAAWQQDRSK